MIAVRFLAACFAIVLFLDGGPRLLAADEPALPAQFNLPKMKTSIYIGSVTLITGAFNLNEGNYTATYEAKVSPWSFWSEAGNVSLTINPADYARLLAGETIELTGEAKNGKGKLRTISARAQPTDATGGRIKVRITASGTTLIFNGTYTVIATPAAAIVATP